MSFFPNAAVLAAETAISSAVWTGATRKLNFTDASAPAPVILLYKMTQSGGSASPTAAVYLEVSADGAKWFRVPMPIATDAAETVQGVEQLPYVCRYLRPVVVMTGGPLPSIALDLQLCSSAPFTMQ